CKPAPYLAHNVLAHARSLFNWAINRGTYGLETSPCDRLKPAALIGPKQPRQRTLNDIELAALWQSSERLGYPFGPLYKLLLLTGARKSEVAGAHWQEFDLDKKVWTVPPERFKSNASHLVPLSFPHACSPARAASASVAARSHLCCAERWYGNGRSVVLYWGALWRQTRSR